MKKLVILLGAIALSFAVLNISVRDVLAFSSVDDAVVCSQEDPNEPVEDVAE